MAATFEHFVAFGTDIVGLERFLRFFQSIFLILTSYPSLIADFLLPSYPPSVHVSTETSLRQLQSHLNLTRRTIRLFWFLGSFQSSWALYTAPAPDGKFIETWLDVLAQSAFGMFGLMESATLLDLARVDGVALFGADKAVRLDAEAQVLWLVALYASALGSGIRLLRLFACRPVPQTGEGFGTALEKEPGAAPGDEAEKERVKMKELAQRRKEERKTWLKEFNDKAGALGMKLLAEMLDLVIPATSIGWIKVDVGFVGVVMFCSTVLTGMAVWAKCGKQLQKRSAEISIETATLTYRELLYGLVNTA
ncbi:hypothetical protein TOPH_06772 [Tolypocladium ophioglossoides CBS 100239]|uniref:AoPex11B-like protein n=1 Tax=Tolypocladium ophioglossoides (strain CBS 100239) TaxID=1163406 RepID=A0A0L0N3M2_TOLOC|nr:hypothetical protein TOPH_06772 [Tolypocladium ophioglossoides CBS 100239]